MPEHLLKAICLFLIMLAVALAAYKQNREADKQGGRNHVRVRFGLGRNTLRKASEEQYTGDRKINRHWDP